MHTRIKDLKIYHEVAGRGTPILMVHGMGVDNRTMSGCMEPIFQSRTDEWKRIYFDLPGMGQTEGANWIRNSDDMVQVILAFVDKIIPSESFLIVGESYGGYLARAIIRERPSRVEGMLLIGPLIVPDDAKRNVPRRSVLKVDETLLETIAPGDRDFFGLFFVDHSEQNWHRFKEEMLSGFQTGDHEFKACIRKIENYELSFDVDSILAPFDKPSLILTGRQDCLAGYRDAWKIIENYPRATFVVLDKAGHGMQIEQEGLFNALVNEWLDRVKQHTASV